MFGLHRSLFNEEHQLFRESVRDFISREISPKNAEWEKQKMVSRDAWLKLGENGFLGIQAPEELGGMNVVFVFKDGRVVTPESDSILEGITRDSLLQLAEDRGYTVENGQLKVALANGATTLKNPAQFTGYQGDAAAPGAILLKPERPLPDTGRDEPEHLRQKLEQIREKGRGLEFIDTLPPHLQKDPTIYAALTEEPSDLA